MVPHLWIRAPMRMLGIADNVIDQISRSMGKWGTNSDIKWWGSVKINRGNFQGVDSFLPLLSIIALITLTHVLRETIMGYQLKKNGPAVNHLLFINDLKMFAKCDKRRCYIRMKTFE